MLRMISRPHPKDKNGGRQTFSQKIGTILEMLNILKITEDF